MDYYSTGSVRLSQISQSSLLLPEIPVGEEPQRRANAGKVTRQSHDKSWR